MKHIAAAIAAVIVMISVIGAIMVIDTRQHREAEMNQALSDSVEEAVSQIMEDSKYQIDGTTDDEANSEFIASFCELLLNDIQSGSDEYSDQRLSVKVDVAGVDYEKGLLSVIVTEKFSYPFYGTGEIKVEKTAVFENDYNNRAFNVVYYDNDKTSIYKQYVIRSGNDLLQPQSTPWADKGVAGVWTDKDGNAVTIPAKVDQDYKFYAKYTE